VILQAVIVGYLCVDCTAVEGLPLLPLAAPNNMDILRSVPVFVCVFLCHFNVIPVFSELKQPTRERAHNMVSPSCRGGWLPECLSSLWL
jgi:amino acid permease